MVVKKTTATPPPLGCGDRLARDEFERRCDAMPQGTKAEVLHGVVHVASPIRFQQHAASTCG